MYNSITNEITERPVILIPDLSNLRHVYNTKPPYLLQLTHKDIKYLNNWRERQTILYEFVKGYEAYDSDIDDPCPYEDSWYIFGVPPFIDQTIHDIIVKNKNISNK